MAVVRVTSRAWSAPIELTSDELWQVQSGRLMVAPWTPSGPSDGLIFDGDKLRAHRFYAGDTIVYRAVTTDALLVRGPVT